MRAANRPKLKVALSHEAEDQRECAAQLCMVCGRAASQQDGTAVGGVGAAVRVVVASKQVGGRCTQLENTIDPRRTRRRR